MALVSWGEAYWSSRQLAMVLLCIRTICFCLTTASFALFFTSLIILGDSRNKTELYRCIFLTLAMSFAYSLSLFTRSTPPPFWRLGWCISGIIQGIGYSILLRRSQEYYAPYFPGYHAYYVNLAGVIVMAVAIVFIAVDAYTSYNTQQDKVIREPLLKNYLLNRVFVRPSTDYRLRAARRARLRRRRRQGLVGPEAGLGPSAGGNRVTNGSSNTSTRNGSNGGEENVESFLENIDLEIQEQQMAMLDQRIRTQQRENWFLSPRIVASPDFNLADHNVALEPLPLYEPPANGIYVPPSQPPMSTTDGAPWPSTGLPRRPPPAAVADEPAPPSYDAILPVPAMAPQPSGPLPTEPQPQSGTPPSSLSQQATEAAAASSVQVTPLSSSSPSTASPSPPPHGGQLPPAYDDIIPPPPVRTHQN